ncbi:MAG: hypothetical protein FGM57_01205 [Candidatus Taylorbacteria bacterium]|nr:hypothetical protein [Candidatus Taylorbacteria bacterium]
MKFIPTTNKEKQKGILEIVVVIIIALVLLRVLGINISEVLAKPWVRDFATYTISMLKLVWQDVLEIVAFVKDLAA